VPDYAALLADAQARAEKLRVELAATEREIMLLEELALHNSHSEGTLSDMQAENSHSLGVRIAEGRKGQSASRKAQIAANLTDKEVATLTGYNRTTVCKWHNGTIKVPEEAQKLLAKRGISRAVWNTKKHPP
jgi:DNA-binding transcriptional regulator YiaG